MCFSTVIENKKKKILILKKNFIQLTKIKNYTIKVLRRKYMKLLTIPQTYTFYF